MMSRAKYWMGMGKPRSQHSLDNLKYLYSVLNKNQTVTDHNKDLLIETLRSISEILIWGDQNDSSVFDFFLEKQMISFFLHYMKQKNGRSICVQILQTLNILFENIRHETSLYFLLSNNHINNIILHKFDFSDEEVMAYYISFLKTLSLKLNTHSIHFFFNERAAEFPLYVEAIKFFDHPESMVRIAVRTLTLNVFKVPVQPMIKFLIEKTANSYFSNVVWLIRNHLLDLDICVKNTVDHSKKCRLIDLIDEHIDHLNYLQDIYALNIEGINQCLSEQLIRRLLVPIYLSSVIKKDKFLIRNKKPFIQPNVALFLLSHLFSVITYEPLLNDLCELIFFIGDEKIFNQMCSSMNEDYLLEPKSLLNYLNEMNTPSTSAESTESRSARSRSKLKSKSYTDFKSTSNETLTASASVVDSNLSQLAQQNAHMDDENDVYVDTQEDDLDNEKDESNESDTNNVILPVREKQEVNEIHNAENITDDEKYRKINSANNIQINGLVFESLLFHLNTQDYNELNCTIAISLFYTLISNPGVPIKLIEKLKAKNISNSSYIELIVNKLIEIISKSVDPDFKVRLATLELAIKLIKKLTSLTNNTSINDFYLACIEQAKEQSSYILRRHFKTEEMFLDMFEHEYESYNSLNVETLLREWSILLPPTSTPLSGIDFVRRFPCGDTEKLKQSIRVFFLLRDLCLHLVNEKENQLPLTKQEALVKENDALDLNSSDLIACTVNLKENKKDRRFLVIDPIQFILVEPEVKRIGWGIVKFSDLIQDVEVTPDKEDSRSLNITIKKAPSVLNGKPEIVLNSVFTFDDHIRCMAAKQHLIRARDRARRMKLEKIAQLLDVVSSSNTNSSSTSLSTQGKTGASYSTSSTPSNEALTYNLVANLNSLNNLPGRASIVNQTNNENSNWSQLMKSPSMLSSPSFYKNQMPFPFNPNLTISYDPTKINPGGSKYASTTGTSSNIKASQPIPQETTKHLESLDLSDNLKEINLKNESLSDKPMNETKMNASLLDENII